MRFSLSWLRAHLDTDASVESLCERAVTALRIPDQSDHPFRLNPITHSGPIRSPVPEFS